MYFTDDEEKPKAQTGSGVFDPAAFTFGPGAYRIHFKNGLSGEYDGAALALNFPFDPREVHRVEEVGAE
ncbi:MAG TPA: hypothetical protein VFI38_13370 [Candidatus Acidoferrum sp.]|nr:hypothetical protein [Candidatus Acidoferrum sp.]